MKLEDVIQEALARAIGVKYLSMRECHEIADAVREWMKEDNACPEEAIELGEPDPIPPNVFPKLDPVTLQTEMGKWQASRIKELEAELARVHEELGHPEIVNRIRGKAYQYDELRKKFPILPGETFYAMYKDRVHKWAAGELRHCADGKFKIIGISKERSLGIFLDSPVYEMWECHHTAEECRAAIPVEET